MWIPITIDEFVKIHLHENPTENENVLRVRIEAALDDYKNGIKCQCGKDIWIVGSSSSPSGCFSCITGRDFPAGDYEIDGALDKKEIDGRININFMDPRKISGIFDDDGNAIDPKTIKKPSLCLTCKRENSKNWEDDVLCNLSRNDKRNSKKFICGAYEKI